MSLFKERDDLYAMQKDGRAERAGPDMRRFACMNGNLACAGSLRSSALSARINLTLPWMKRS